METDSTTSQNPWLQKVICICRYDSESGIFTVPSGRDGFYYFSVYLSIWGREYGFFDIKMNGQNVCTTGTDEADRPFRLWPGQAACSGTIYATAGTKQLFKNFM